MFKSEDGSIVRPTAKAEDTRRRILATALDLFQERGFAETTMREIARKAEVATGAAYYYFPSKEAIIMAFYWQTQTEFEARLPQASRRNARPWRTHSDARRAQARAVPTLPGRSRGAVP